MYRWFNQLWPPSHEICRTVFLETVGGVSSAEGATCWQPMKWLAHFSVPLHTPPSYMYISKDSSSTNVIQFCKQPWIYPSPQPNYCIQKKCNGASLLTLQSLSDVHSFPVLLELAPGTILWHLTPFRKQVPRHLMYDTAKLFTVTITGAKWCFLMPLFLQPWPFPDSYFSRTICGLEGTQAWISTALLLLALSLGP